MTQESEKSSVLTKTTTKGTEPVASGIKDTNPKTVYGKAKPSIGLIPGPALLHIADAFKDGAVKYGPANWRDDPVSATVYIDATYRHILAWADGGEGVAADSGVHHLGHAAACLCILLDAEAQGTLVDDRPTPGRVPDLIAQLTKKIN
jgi:pyruvate/2-oxoacid:ferredoxin oxidoreductase beta subunit